MVAGIFSLIESTGSPGATWWQLKKSITMATAVWNVERLSPLTTGYPANQDLHCGAGEVNAYLAARLAIQPQIGSGGTAANGYDYGFTEANTTGGFWFLPNAYQETLMGSYNVPVETDCTQTANNPNGVCRIRAVLTMGAGVYLNGPDMDLDLVATAGNYGNLGYPWVSKLAAFSRRFDNTSEIVDFLPSQAVGGAANLWVTLGGKRPTSPQETYAISWLTYDGAVFGPDFSL